MTYFDRFFDEKALDQRTYEVTDSHGLTHFVPTEVVVEAIKGTTGAERAALRDMLVRLDFANADIHHFLAHLAAGLAEAYHGVPPSPQERCIYATA